MIAISKNGIELPYKQWLFPGGEVGVKLEAEHHAFLREPAEHTKIVARLHHAKEVVELAMVVDALRNLDPRPIELVMPYVPYGRQDRACVRGEANSLKVFAGMINALGFRSVEVFDPHSDVVGAVFDRLRIVTQAQIVHGFEEFNKRVLAGATFVSPDAGANKKTAELAKYFNHFEFVRADKLRDLSTGNIKETIVYADDLKGRDVVIADDICDGGRTFVELAKVLKSKNAGKVVLYVTHAIFSQGTDPLFKGGIDEIFMTDSWGGKTQHDLGPRITTMKLER